MRSLLFALVALALVTGGVEARAEPAPRRAKDSLARARALDQQGAKAYVDGRYNDAIRYFEEAYRLGGPPFELWNIAKCYLRLDQPERAAAVLERYLATPDLPAKDRAEAEGQLDALRRRPSTLTVSSTPSGATVRVDDAAPLEGRTPVSVSVAPGPHTVTVSLPLYETFQARVSAKYGRAIILDAPLAKDRAPVTEAPFGDSTEEGSGPGPAPEEPSSPAAPIAPGLVEVRGLLGASLPRYGSVGGSASVAGILAGSYQVATAGGTSLRVGALLELTSDAWDNTVGAPGTAAPCGPLRNPREATAPSFFATGEAAFAIVPRVRAALTAGLGVAGYVVDQTGGDLFVPSCSPSPGVRPALLLASRVDVAVTRAFRVSVMPLALHVQPAFGGAREAPLDASGIWLRALLGVGVGFDLL